MKAYEIKVYEEKYDGNLIIDQWKNTRNKEPESIIINSNEKALTVAISILKWVKDHYKNKEGEK